MSTRSLTKVTSEGQTYVNMYRQSDGYPSGLGRELFLFLKDIEIVNGLSSNPEKVANGPGCLAAQLVTHFKEGPGGIYLYPAAFKDCNQEYEYTVDVRPDETAKIRITVCEVPDSAKRKRIEIFSGTVPEFGAWTEAQ